MSTAWEEFQELTEDALRYTRERNEGLLKKWLNKIGYTKPVGYYYNYSKKEIELYTTRPGLLIGKHGVHIFEFKDMLKEEFGYEWTVKFVQIRGGFVNVGKEN